MRRIIGAILAWTLLGGAGGREATADPATLFGRPLERGGFSGLVAFGYGGGPTSSGIFHQLELGRSTPATQSALVYSHVFIFSDGVAKPTGGSDLFGGHFLVLKLPFFLRELVVKVGAGLGENVDLRDGFDARFGVGWVYGLDLHLPLAPTNGLTLSVLGVHAATVDRGHQLGWAASVGYAWF